MQVTLKSHVEVRKTLYPLRVFCGVLFCENITTDKSQTIIQSRSRLLYVNEKLSLRNVRFALCPIVLFVSACTNTVCVGKVWSTPCV